MAKEGTKELIEFMKIQGALSYQFEITSMLGKGVIGKVYNAKSRDDGKTYAIKAIPYGVKNMEFMERYQKRELELLTRFDLSNCSNVIKYIGSWIAQIGEGESRLCIQMELCSVDLGTFVYRNKIAGPDIIQAQGPPRFYQQVFQQILNGLAFIHSMGWVHRDIHPGNILIANSNPKRISDIQVKIADFGLARYIGIDFDKLPDGSIKPKFERLTPLGEICDISVAYTAPEIKEKQPYDFKVDVYSAGVVLYFISRYPVIQDHSSLKSEVKAVTEGQLEYTHHKDDEKLRTLIYHLLQKDPSKRPSIHHAKEYMFPTEKPTIEFFARKEDEDDYSRCRLKELTLSALIEAVKSGTGSGVKTDGKNLREVCKVDEEKKRAYIKCDDDVRAMFHERAASNKRDVEVIVLKKPEDRIIETGQVAPET